MSTPSVIAFDDMDARLNWPAIMHAIKAGHQLARAQINDVVLRCDQNTLLNRSAWIEGLGMMVKVATIFPDMPPAIKGGVMFFDAQDGTLRAVIDFALITKWKTISDSLLGAQHLARPDSRHLLCIGAGSVIAQAIDGYRSLFEGLKVAIWNRSPARGAKLADAKGAVLVEDLAKAVGQADIICCATMSATPIIKGAWLRAGTHLDLIGAYKSDMREVDDMALSRSRIFVDSYDSTLEHIGELCDPLARGIITRGDVLADFYTLARGDGRFGRQNADEITLFKNGGGAHLDLMVADAVYRDWDHGEK